MGFEIRKKRKYVKAMKKMNKEVKVALTKLQEEMKKYVDRNRREVVEYKVEDGVLLSMKDLMWQMKNREIKKLTEKFVWLYKIKKIISENVVELGLLALIKIHPVVNVSRIVLYQEQIERWKKSSPSLVKMDEEKKYEVKKILNRRDVRGS